MAESKKEDDKVTIWVNRKIRRDLRLLAALTGKTMQEAAEVAIKEQLAKVQKEQE